VCFKLLPLSPYVCFRIPGANRLLANPGLLQSRSCFGCCAKPTPITAAEEPSKRSRIQGCSIRKASLTEEFWSSSARDMDNSAIQSQRSISLISTVAQSNDQHAAGSSSNPNEFVNQGNNNIIHYTTLFAFLFHHVLS
jgi:hypothetical protein